MNIADPATIELHLAEYFRKLQTKHEQITKEQAEKRLLLQIDRVRDEANKLDGSQLGAFKHEVKELYSACIAWLRTQGQSTDLMNIGRTLAMQRIEQQELPVHELKSQFPEALKNMKNAVKNREFLELFALMGRILGSVGG